MKKVITDNEDVYFLEKEDVTLVQFENLKKYQPGLVHCFTTRLGGVSSEECTSLNLGFNRKDDRLNVLENFKRVAGCLGIEHINMVFSNQVHDNKIRIVGRDDRGKGIIRESDIKGYDGLVTNQKDVALVTFYADCVPVFLYDPEKKAIGLSHSGWRGTVKEIARETVSIMTGEFGCRASALEAAIGPSIGQCCFEVGNEVYEEFAKSLPWSSEFCTQKSETKWNIGLQAIIKKTLVDCGLIEDNICVSGICTKCNSNLFFSHRGHAGKTGSLAAVMQLRDESI